MAEPKLAAADPESPGTPGDSGAPAAVRTARWAVSVAFAANGALLGTWAPRIPEAQRQLGIDHAALGLTLFALAAGSLTAMPLAGWIMKRRGSPGVLRLSTVFACLVPGAVGAADSVAAVWPALFLWGLALGSMDVAMNAQAVTVQKAHPRTVINSVHACFSLGGLLGAAAGSLAAAAHLPLSRHLAGAGLLALLCCAPLLRRFLQDAATGPAAPAPTVQAPGTGTGTGTGTAAEPVTTPISRQPVRASGPTPRGTLVLCMAAFAAMLAEGATADWSAIRLEETGLADGTAGLGYTAFAVAMLIGRACGDKLSRRMGHARTAAAAALAGCAGVTAGFALSGPVQVTLAFAAMGLGLSCLMPFLFTAAGSGEQGTAVAVTAISTSGYIGLLAGPTLIGALAQLSTVASALWLLPLLLLLGSLPALRAVRTKETA